MCHTMFPQCTLLSTFLTNVQCRHWSGLRPLNSATLSTLDPHRDSPGISYCCPGSQKSCSLDLKDQTLHMLQHFTDGVAIGVEQLKALDLGPGWQLSWTGCTQFSCTMPLGCVLQLLPWPAHPIPQPQGAKSSLLLSCSQAGSPVLLSAGPVLLCCVVEVQSCFLSATASEGQGKLSCSQDLWALSPVCHR